jgi:hypothetical protein
LRNEVGYEPRFDAEGAVKDFVSKSAASRRLFPSPVPSALAQRITGS